MSFTYSKDRYSGDNSNSGNYVQFFSLKNDGDEAIVRFNIETTNDFILETTHSVQVDGKFKTIKCIRPNNGDTITCPLCASNRPARDKIFLTFIQYEVDAATGAVKCTPRVWERPYSMAHKMASLIDDYGPLNKMLFKIKRHGAARSMETTYDVLPIINPSYTVENFPADFSAFAKFDLSERTCLEKTYEELQTFVTTGAFPQSEKPTVATQTAYVPNVQPQVATQPQPQPNFIQPQPAAAPFMPTPGVTPQPTSAVVPPPWFNTSTNVTPAASQLSPTQFPTFPG